MILLFSISYFIQFLDFKKFLSMCYDFQFYICSPVLSLEFQFHITIYLLNSHWMPATHCKCNLIQAKIKTWISHNHQTCSFSTLPHFNLWNYHSFDGWAKYLSIIFNFHFYPSLANSVPYLQNMCQIIPFSLSPITLSYLSNFISIFFLTTLFTPQPLPASFPWS